MAPPQTRSLRSKKRASCSAEEFSQTHDVQAAPLQKDTEGDINEADNTLLQPNLQDSATVTNIHHQGEERCSLSKPEDSNLGNNSDGTDATGMANKAEEETTVHDPDHHFELVTCDEQADDCPNGKETGSEECSRSPSQPQMFAPASEDDSESCRAVLEKQVVGKEHSNLKRNQDTDDDKTSFCLSDVKEAAVRLPAKKKRRMGMCGLTEKERSHFLQAQQCDSAQNGAGSSEKQALEEDVSPTHLQSTPPRISAEVVEEREEEPRPPHSGDDHQAETEAHNTVTGPDGTGTTSNLGCSEGRNSEAKGGYQADPELNGKTEPIEPEKEEKHLENLQPPEVKEPSTGNVALVAEIQIKTEEDLSSKVQTNSLNETYAMQQEESYAEAPRPERLYVNGAPDESKLQTTDEICGNGAEGASSGGNDGFNCASEASTTPTVQEMNYSVSSGLIVDPKTKCNPNDDPAAGPSVVRTEHAPTRDLEGSLGSGCLDYVSDSQLNTIALIEEREEEPEPSGCLEDATELICGLIRELSSLNRKVMVAHRELENLRRKPSRSSVR